MIGKNMNRTHGAINRMAVVVAALLIAGGAGVRPASADETLFVPGEYETIQAAIDAASDGDLVFVQAGTYHEAIDLLGKAIAVAGVPGETILSGENLDGPIVTMASGEGPGTELEGLVLADGSADEGAGLYVEGASPTITGCRFIGNHGQRGGAVHVSGGSPTLIDCRFFENTASGPGRGAAIYIDAGHVTVTNGLFDLNSGRWGGAIYAIESELELDGGVFFDNVAEQEGGAVWLQFTDAAIDRTVFASNEAHADPSDPSPAFGGAMYVLLGDVQVNNSSFLSNSVTGYDSIGGGGGQGGAAWVHGEAVFSGCAFQENVSGGDTTAGGALVVSNGAVVDQCTFISNEADVGGAVWLGSASTIRNSHFEANAAHQSGGAVARAIGGWPDDDVPTIESCTFKSNTAPAAGAVSIVDDLVLTDSVFKGNTAESGAGALAIAFSAEVVSIESCDFFNNQAIGSGGAVYVNMLDDLNLQMHDCLFEGNSAGEQGSAVTVTGGGAGEMTVDGCAFRSNTSPAGAALYVADNATPPEVQFSEFCGNSPRHIAGAWIDLGENLFGPYCPIGDLTGDGTVGGADLGTLLSKWGPCDDPDDCPADLNGDGAVGGADLGILLSNWGD